MRPRSAGSTRPPTPPGPSPRRTRPPTRLPGAPEWAHYRPPRPAHSTGTCSTSTWTWPPTWTWLRRSTARWRRTPTSPRRSTRRSRRTWARWTRWPPRSPSRTPSSRSTSTQTPTRPPTRPPPSASEPAPPPRRTMTDPQTAPIPVPAGAPAPAGADGEVLARADGVELLGEVPGSGYRRAPALARRGDGQVLTLTPLLHAVLAAVDGRRTVAEVAEEVGNATGRLVRPDDVRKLVAASLRPLGLLRLADGSEPEVRRSSPLLALRFRRGGTDPAGPRRLPPPFPPLFPPPVVAAPVGALPGGAGLGPLPRGVAPGPPPGL